MCYNMDEPWHYARWMKAVTEDQIRYDSIWDVQNRQIDRSTIDKSIEERKLEDNRERLTHRGFFLMLLYFYKDKLKY